MTKDDYTLLAAALAQSMPTRSENVVSFYDDLYEDVYRQWRSDVLQVSKACQVSDPEFDRKKFEAECRDKSQGWRLRRRQYSRE